MEEILASIRRIISEDGPPEDPSPASGSTLEPMAVAGDAGEDDLLVFEDFQPEAAHEDPAPEPVNAAPPPRAPEPSAVAPARPAPTLVSDPAAALAAGALTRLAGTLRVADVEGQTLEGIVQDLLRPMLREWLDAHLPSIVEAKVEAELDRISRLVR
jgi:cell pole-organizing protein PopZ